MIIRKGRVLWVQGQKDMLATIARVLQDDGFEVVSASTSAAGLKFARESRFDLYFFDLCLPGMSGVELSRSIRDFDQDTPILFISAGAINAEMKRAAACELQACLIEPANFETLKQTIRFLVDSPAADGVDFVDSRSLQSSIRTAGLPRREIETQGRVDPEDYNYGTARPSDTAPSI